MSLGKVIDEQINDLSIKIDKQKVPKHIAIIMDGNGRWATKKGLPRSFGHKQGVSVLKKILKSAKNLGCKVLTVYAFSTENWTRPTKEVDFLINLFSEVLRNEIEEIHEESTKIKFIGDLTPFPETLKKIIYSSESLTKDNNKFTLLRKFLPLFLLPEKCQIILFNKFPPSKELIGIKFKKPKNKLNIPTLEITLTTICS